MEQSKFWCRYSKIVQKSWVFFWLKMTFSPPKKNFFRAKFTPILTLLDGDRFSAMFTQVPLGDENESNLMLVVRALILKQRFVHEKIDTMKVIEM